MAKVTGVEGVRSNLAALGRAPGGKALDGILSWALQPMRQATSDNARTLRQPLRTPRGGHLDEGVVVAKVEGRGQFYRVFWVSFKRRARKLAHLVEFGTAPHWQPLRNRMHPGARPKPFMRPAFEATKGRVAQEVGSRFWAGMVATIRGVTK